MEVKPYRDALCQDDVTQSRANGHAQQGCSVTRKLFVCEKRPVDSTHGRSCARFNSQDAYSGRVLIVARKPFHYTLPVFQEEEPEGV
ncbi:MAG TPA: hypothetical protein VFM46_13200, partial [Pseudomonadales bacterium]|nr:hypothetical protein [Pseudomonadales bacterium]